MFGKRMNYLLFEKIGSDFDIDQRFHQFELRLQLFQCIDHSGAIRSKVVWNKSVELVRRSEKQSENNERKHTKQKQKEHGKQIKIKSE
jgi:hypothetical protein